MSQICLYTINTVIMEIGDGDYYMFNCAALCSQDLQLNVLETWMFLMTF